MRYAREEKQVHYTIKDKKQHHLTVNVNTDVFASNINLFNKQSIKCRIGGRWKRLSLKHM